jgi:hypothetical protein
LSSRAAAVKSIRMSLSAIFHKNTFSTQGVSSSQCRRTGRSQRTSPPSCAVYQISLCPRCRLRAYHRYQSTGRNNAGARECVSLSGFSKTGRESYIVRPVLKVIFLLHFCSPNVVLLKIIRLPNMSLPYHIVQWDQRHDGGE